MEKKIKELIQNYKDLRSQSLSMQAYLYNSDDILKVEAGIVTLTMMIDDLEALLKN